MYYSWNITFLFVEGGGNVVNCLRVAMNNTLKKSTKTYRSMYCPLSEGVRILQTTSFENYDIIAENFNF